MDREAARESLRIEKLFLGNVLKQFRPEHETFAPKPGMMNVAQQINHVAHTIEWFREGAFGKGFDLDFEGHLKRDMAPVTLEQAMDHLERAYADYYALLDSISDEDLLQPMPYNDIFKDAPRFVVFPSQADHTAHHRGVLTVYLRLLDIEPALVYDGY